MLIPPKRADSPIPPIAAPLSEPGGLAHPRPQTNLAQRAAGALRSVQVGHPHENPRVSRWRVARAGGVGAASGLFLALGLFGPESIVYKPWEDVGLFILVGLITIILGFSVIEPFVEWLHHGSPDHGQAVRLWYQRAAWWLVIIIAVSLFALMEDVLRETLTVGKFENISKWFGALVVSGLITLGWTLGAKRGAPFATLYGTLAAVAMSLLVAAVIVLSVVISLTEQNIPVRPSDILTELGGVLAVLVNNMVTWTLCAAAGGFAIDYGRGLTPSLRVLISIVVVFGLMTIGLYPLADDPRAWVADSARALGWGVALCLYRPADFALTTRREPSWIATGLSSLVIGSLLILATIGGFLLSLLGEQGNVRGQPIAQHRMMVAGINTGEHGRFALSYAFYVPGMTDDQTDLALRVWDMEAREEYRRLIGHTDRILDAAFLHSVHGVLASAAADHTLRLWDVEHGAQVFEQPFPIASPGESLVAARFSPNGEFLAVATDKPRLLLYDTANGKMLREFDDPPAIRAIAFLDEDTFFTAGAALTRWDVHKSQSALSMTPTDAPLTTIDARGKFVATGSDSGELRLYNAEGITLQWFEDPKIGEVTAVSFAPSSDRLLAGFEDGSLGLWDVSTGDLYYATALSIGATATRPAGSPSTPIALHMTSDLTAFTGDDAGRLILWRLPHHYPWSKKLNPPGPLPPTTSPAASAPEPP